jgi:hypothetical protein
MNVFRLAGDMMHLLSILVLLLKITGTKSCRGAKTMQMILLKATWCCASKIQHP